MNALSRLQGNSARLLGRLAANTARALEPVSLWVSRATRSGTDGLERLPTAHPHRARRGPETLPPSAPPAVAAPPAPRVIALGARLNGRDRWLPLHADALRSCTELHRAGEIARAAGGFQASLLRTPLLEARMGMRGCTDFARVQRRISAVAGDLLQWGMDAVPQHSVPAGCIPALGLCDRGHGDLDAILYTENVAPSGQRIIGAAAQAIALPIARLAECTGSATIQLGVLEAQRVRVRCRIQLRHLGDVIVPAPGARDAGARLNPTRLDTLLRRLGIDSHEPLLAAKHNAHVLHAVTAAAAALGLEPRQLEVAARSHAARWGSCEPLGRWRRRGHELLGELQLPVDLDSIERGLPLTGSGSLDAHLRRHTASDLLLQVACVGLAASLGFLRLALIASAPQRRRGNLSPPPSSTPRTQSASRSQTPYSSVITESGVHPAVGAGSPLRRVRTA